MANGFDTTPPHGVIPISGEQRIQSGEYASPKPNGLVLNINLKKWSLVLGVIVAGSVVLNITKSCVMSNADAVGLQTVEAAEKTYQAKKDAERFEKDAIQAHTNMWKAIETIEQDSADAADHAKRTYDALPKAWKKRTKHR